MIKVGDFPKCIFCDDHMRDTGGTISGQNGQMNRELCRFYFDCINDSCLVIKDFQRYKIVVDGYGNLINQEYAITDDIYVKVFKDTSLIYHMIASMLVDEIRVPRALWLNPTNIPQTLTKLRTLITFS